jgi:hypothetical protein
MGMNAVGRRRERCGSFIIRTGDSGAYTCHEAIIPEEDLGIHPGPGGDPVHAAGEPEWLREQRRRRSRFSRTTPMPDTGPEEWRYTPIATCSIWTRCAGGGARPVTTFAELPAALRG